MFKRLRDRLLLLNLSIISVMMIVAFTAIYLITYNDVKGKIDSELYMVSEIYRKPYGIQPQPRTGTETRPDEKDAGTPERSVSFAVITGSDMDIYTVISVFDMEDSFYEEMVGAALSDGETRGYFKYDGSHWAYMMLQAPDKYMFVFLDTSARQSILTEMIYTFLLVAAVMLVFIYIISRFFANRAIRPVKDAFEKQKEFIADASHELRTPLSVINTNVDVLLSNSEDNIKNQMKWLEYIKTESENMTKLTNDLLYLTQVDYSDVKKIFYDFDFSREVENVVLSMEAAAYEHRISLSYDIEHGHIVHGNNTQLREVVMILIENAFKYTDIDGKVDVNVKKIHGGILLTVTNTGEEIPDIYLEKIFNRFYRLDKSRTRKSGSYGLGLAIAKTIVEQHKGKIYAKSVINESTSFSVELPLA